MLTVHFPTFPTFPTTFPLFPIFPPPRSRHIARKVLIPQ